MQHGWTWARVSARAKEPGAVATNAVVTRIQRVCVLLGMGAIAFLSAACGTTPMVQNPVAQSPVVTFTSAVENVSPGTRTIAVNQTLQGYSVVTLIEGAPIGDSNGNALTLQDLQTGMVIQVSGQTAGPSSVLASSIRVLTPSAAPTLPMAEGRAAGTVESFLSGLAVDPTGNSSLRYTSRAFQESVTAGTPVPWMVGVVEPIPSYNISLVEPVVDPERVNLLVRLNYALPFDRVFVLVQENGAWRVDRIIAP